MPGSNSDVVIVGAGPVGLACAFMLGRQGVDVRVLERRSQLSSQPRAHVLHARTVELLRGWGLADGIRAAGLPRHLSTSFGWLTELRAKEFAVVDYIDDETTARYSPEQLISCPQDAIERELLYAVQRETDVTVDFSREVVAFRATEGGGQVDIRSASGTTAYAAASFIVAADGASSGLRTMAGISMPRSAPLARRLNLWFEADLTEYTRNRPFMLWLVHNAATQGTFIALDGVSRWVYSFEIAINESKSDYDPVRCRDIIRAAVGDPGLSPNMLGVATWNVDMGVADEFRRGPLFLVGDAAHSFPPSGGYGMNSGIQDAQNLAWKLAAVLKGDAGCALLDTYEIERRPVAAYNASQSLQNAQHSKEAADHLASPEVLALLATDAGAELRAGIARALAQPSPEFHSLGQQFGQIYHGAAIVDDGSDPRPSTTMEYVVTARPGARAPHVRLVDRSRRSLSSIDLVKDTWTLLVAGPANDWIDRVEHVRTQLGLAVRIFEVIQSATATETSVEQLVVETGAPGFAEVYEIDPGTDSAAGGAVLIRPDGYVGARWPTRTVGLNEVTFAIASILSRTVTETQVSQT